MSGVERLNASRDTDINNEDFLFTNAAGRPETEILINARYTCNEIIYKSCQIRALMPNI